MGFPILVRWHLYIESGTRWCFIQYSNASNRIQISLYNDKKYTFISHPHSGTRREFPIFSKGSISWDWQWGDYGLGKSFLLTTRLFGTNFNKFFRQFFLQTKSNLKMLSAKIVLETKRYLFWSWDQDILGDTGPWFKIKMPSYQYRKSHYGDKMVVRSSNLHNGISYTGKMASLYWISPLVNTMSAEAMAPCVTRPSTG